MVLQLELGLVDRLERCAGQFELAAGLQRNRPEARSVGKADQMPAIHDGLPTEALPHPGEQGADAALAVIRNGSVALAVEGKFLVLGADAIGLDRLATLLDPVDELVAALDRRRVRDVARHADCSFCR